MNCLLLLGRRLSFAYRRLSLLTRYSSLITHHSIIVAGCLLFSSSLLCAASAVRLNEVASQESSPNTDWVELYVASGTVDMTDWKLYEQSSLVKTFPSANFTYSAGTYIVIHFNSNADDETTATGDVNGNGSVDLYTTDSGLTGTSNVITIRNAQGLIIDAVVFSDDNSWTSTQQTAFNLVVTTGQWTGTIDGGSTVNFSESVNVSGGIGSGNSIGRDQNSTDTDGSSTANSDWSYIRANQTMGKVNPAQTVCPAGSGNIAGWITEIAPSISGADFIEIFVTEGSNLCGVKLYESDTLIKTFPSVTPKSGSFGAFIVLNASMKVTETADETDMAGDRNFNGYIDLYSDENSPGLTGSSNNNITLKNADGTIVDFMSWSLMTDDGYSSAKQARYDQAVSTGKWAPSCASGDINCYIAGSISWSNKSTESMSRRVGSNGAPQDSKPSGAGDWQIGIPTPGKGYGSAIQPKGEILEVFQSPFSPFGDGRYSEAIFGYKVPAQSIVAIQIYDIQGNLIRAVLDNIISKTDETQTVTWDGRDADARIAPIGIYVVHIEVQKPDGGIDRESKTVVVGRKL